MRCPCRAVFRYKCASHQSTCPEPLQTSISAKSGFGHLHWGAMVEGSRMCLEISRYDQKLGQREDLGSVHECTKTARFVALRFSPTRFAHRHAKKRYLPRERKPSPEMHIEDVNSVREVPEFRSTRVPIPGCANMVPAIPESRCRAESTHVLRGPWARG